MASLVSLPVQVSTRQRVYQAKGPGVSYDKFVIELMDAYEEKREEHRSPPASIGTGHPVKETQ